MAHAHDHTHTHDHGHDHSHDGDTYFIDQLCMVGLSGAFGMICLCLWFLQYSMLTLMLGAQFHYYVLASGVVLVTIALARGVILWKQSRDPNFKGGHDHDHDHGHAHHHDHAHEHGIKEGAPTQLALQTELKLVQHDTDCGHAHQPGESCAHEHHSHDPKHEHGHHHHDHDAADHDHGWAPWRYVVILVPIILFLLGLPNKPPSLKAGEGMKVFAIAPDAETYVRLTLLGEDTASKIALLGMYFNPPPSEKGDPVAYNTLEAMAKSADTRAHWKNKTIEVKGQYSPMQGSNQIFQLVRLKISCCANDAVQLNVPMVCNEPIKGIALSDWVQVTGRIDFREYGGAHRTVVLISKASDIVKCNPEVNPYVQ